MNRRTFLGGAVPAVTFGGERDSKLFGVVRPGEETWSESLMFLHFDPDVRNGVSVRVSRYPDLGVTWVWFHVLFKGRVYSYTDRSIPCDEFRNTGTSPVGDYSTRDGSLEFVRTGSVTNLTEIRLDGGVRCWMSPHGQDGPGGIRVGIEANFRPSSVKRNLPPGRSEWTGLAEIKVTVGGQELRLSGVSKAHEQTQTAPRFGGPFTYAMLWSPSASLVATSSPGRRYGDFELDGQSYGVTEFRPQPPGRDRQFSARLETGRLIKGNAHRMAAYSVPVFDRYWRGSIVKANIDGNQLLGMINDWRPEDQIYEF